MALQLRCERGHSYLAPDIVDRKELPAGAPHCPHCRLEWAGLRLGYLRLDAETVRIDGEVYRKLSVRELERYNEEQAEFDLRFD